MKASLTLVAWMKSFNHICACKLAELLLALISFMTATETAILTSSVQHRRLINQQGTGKLIMQRDGNMITATLATNHVDMKCS